MLDRYDPGFSALFARLRREGLRPSEFLFIEDVESLRGAVAACNGAPSGQAPIILLSPEMLKDDTPIEVGDVRLDPVRCLVRVRGREWLLRAKPAAVLAVLMRNAGRAVPREVLVRQVWGGPRRSASGPLRVYIHDLRRIVELDPARPKHIVTLRGDQLAYCFRP